MRTYRPSRQKNRKRPARRWLWLLPAAVLLAGLLVWAHSMPAAIPFRDRLLPIHWGVPRSHYVAEQFEADGTGRVEYRHRGKKAKLGIDVSYYQETIDWQAVAADGVEFAIIRLGLRGYTTGEVQLDPRFEENMRGAQAAGLPVGVYFFSQAITPAEAVEEAEFVLSALAGRELAYPVVFDWETIGKGRTARTDDLTGEEITACALAFARTVEAGGYEPMIYFNRELGYLGYDLTQLKDYPFWLARYEAAPDFFYDFDLWQYSHTGRVDGIRGQVDLNLDLRETK